MTAEIQIRSRAIAAGIPFTTTAAGMAAALDGIRDQLKFGCFRSAPSRNITDICTPDGDCRTCPDPAESEILIGRSAGIRRMTRDPRGGIDLSP